MKVALVQPPIEDYYITGIRTQPLGLCYLAASLEDIAEPVLLDFLQPRRPRMAEHPPGFEAVQDIYDKTSGSPFGLFSQYWRYGPDDDLVCERIAMANPDVVAFSNLFTTYFPVVKRIIREFKIRYPHIPVILGGHHCSTLPEAALKESGADFIVSGPGCLSFRNLVGTLSGKYKYDPSDLPGVGHIIQNEFRYRPHAEGLSETLDYMLTLAPDRSVLEPNRYKIGRDRYTMIMSSFGCPHKCRFCTIHDMFGKSYVRRSNDDILKEMQAAHEDYGITAFDFEDDNFTLHREKSLDLLQSIRNEFGDSIRFFAMNGISIESLDPALVSALREAGLKNLNVAIGSAGKEMIKRSERPAGLEKYESIAAAAHACGMNLTTYYILGIPGDTVINMMDTISYLAGKKTLLGPSFFYPLPGMDYFETHTPQDFKMNEYEKMRSSYFPVAGNTFSKDDLMTLAIVSRLVNYLKGVVDEVNPHEIISLSQKQKDLLKNLVIQGYKTDKSMTCKDLLNL